jgi:hypothetical protein
MYFVYFNSILARSLSCIWGCGESLKPMPIIHSFRLDSFREWQQIGAWQGARFTVGKTRPPCSTFALTDFWYSYDFSNYQVYLEAGFWEMPRSFSPLFFCFVIFFFARASHVTRSRHTITSHDHRRCYTRTHDHVRECSECSECSEGSVEKVKIGCSFFPVLNA